MMEIKHIFVHEEKKMNWLFSPQDGAKALAALHVYGNLSENITIPESSGLKENLKKISQGSLVKARCCG